MTVRPSTHHQQGDTVPTFDPSDCAFCAAPALHRLPNGADVGCPLHGTARVHQPQKDTVADKPYTDADVQLVARAIFMDDYPDSDPGPDMAQSQMPGLHEYVQNARAVLDALAAAGRLAEVELNDIEATGECCCNGCIGMGPCDLDLGRTDD